MQVPLSPITNPAAAAAAPAPASTERARADGSMTLRVGEWWVEPSLNRLSAAGKVTRLEPKAMAVLVHLAEQPGQVVSREVLLAHVWPDVVVGDDSLTQVVIKLRKALGDVPGSPAYIQTISKRGYRLIAEVSRSAQTVAQPLLPPKGGRSTARSWRESRMAASAGVVALLFVVAAAALWIERGSPFEAASRPAALADAAASRAQPPSVAIQPFEVLGSDPQAKLLASGLTADILTNLSRESGIWVVGAASADGAVASKSAAAASPVHYLVSGSVERVGEAARLYIHLSDTATGRQLWSERFDRQNSNVLALQEELRPILVQTLSARVGQAERRRAAQRYTRNLQAYEYFLRGQAALLVRQRSENDSAREMYWRAIELDPAFARAYAGLALTHAADYRNQWVPNRAGALDRAFELARTAYQIDPEIPETCWVLAFVHIERRQYDQARLHLENALRLDPSYADAYALMGGLNSYVGRPAETVRLLRTAMRLDPEAGYLDYLLLGRAYLFLGDWEQARVNLEQAQARNVGNLETHVYLAALYAAVGDKAAAAWQADEIRSLQPGFTGRHWLETYPMTDLAQRNQLLRALGELGL